MMATATTPVGRIATEHPLATRVFARYNIDFCCGGGRPLKDACAAKKLDTSRVLAEIEDELAEAPGSEVRWDQEPIAALIEHILKRVHEPLKEELPRLEEMARKVHRVHGEKDPALEEILQVVLALKSDLEQHMMKEEQVLFPMVLAGNGSAAGGPVSVMEAEHEAAGEFLARLRTLTRDFEVPEGACTTWRALWAGLADLEVSLHEHIHLENNILHKRALAS